MTSVLEEIAQSRAVAVLRSRDASRFAEIATVLAKAGVTCIEFTLSSEGAVDALRTFARHVPPRRRPRRRNATRRGVGARGRPRRRAVPHLAGAVPRRRRAGDRARGPGDPGCADAFRNPRGVAGRRGRHPPTDGVTADNARAYLEAGALAVGLGASLIGDAGEGGEVDALRQRTEAVVRGVGGAAA